MILRVSFPDGSVIQESKPTDTFRSAICKIGLEKVNESGILAVAKKQIPLVGREEGPRTTQVDRWYVYNKLGTERMKELLSKLSEQLNCGLDVVLVESGQPDRKDSVDRRVLVEMEGGSYAEKFKKAVEAIGPERVQALGIIRSGRNIVYVPAPGQQPGEGQLTLRNGLLLNTKFSNDVKDAILQEIAAGLGIVIRTIKSTQ